MFSRRTRLSLGQYLELQEYAVVTVLLEKHGMPGEGLHMTHRQFLRGGMEGASEEQLRGLLDEIIRTSGDLRSRIAPRYRHDERWRDLFFCLNLDGYRLEAGERLVAVDPTVEGAAPVEDDLTAELNRSRLAESQEIVRLINSSGDAFRRAPPDYNGCLTTARVALETLGRAIARSRLAAHPGNFDETRWGQVLAYLRTSGLVSVEEEQGIAGVYGFVSPGAHRPIGLTEQETARLGRSLAAAMSYFLIKRHNGGA